VYLLAPSASVHRLLKLRPTRLPAGRPKVSLALFPAQRIMPLAVVQNCEHRSQHVMLSVHGRQGKTAVHNKPCAVALSAEEQYTHVKCPLAT